MRLNPFLQCIIPCLYLIPSQHILQCLLGYLKGLVILNLLLLRTESEGKSFGKRLLIEAETSAREAGMESIWLDTEITNSRALSLYLKSGYKISEINKKVQLYKDL